MRSFHAGELDILVGLGLDLGVGRRGVRAGVARRLGLENLVDERAQIAQREYLLEQIAVPDLL